MTLNTSRAICRKIHTNYKIQILPSQLSQKKKKKIPQLLQGRTDLMREENFNRDPNKQTHTEKKDQLKDSNLLFFFFFFLSRRLKLTLHLVKGKTGHWEKCLLNIYIFILIHNCHSTFLIFYFLLSPTLFFLTLKYQNLSLSLSSPLSL